MNVLLTGFKSEKHARTFIDWFEGQGEQDQQVWFDEHNLESQTVDVSKKYTKNGDTITVYLQKLTDE